MTQLGPPTVVVVNCDRSILDLMRDVLDGYRVITCAVGGEARPTIAAARPSLVILDPWMPDVPDRLILDELRRDPSTATLPVLVCSAAWEPAAVGRSAAGRIDVLPMPFEIDALLENVRHLVSEPRCAFGRHRSDEHPGRPLGGGTLDG